MFNHRNGKRPRPFPEQGSTKIEVTRKLFKLSKDQHVVDISTSTASDSHLCLLNEEKDCDVTFLVGPSNDRIPCHQLFLKARSPVFQTMFSNRWNEGNKEIEVPDINPATFRTFLQFLYADELDVVGSDEALNLLYVAQKYDVQSLVKKCEQLLKMNLRLPHCMKVIRYGIAYGKENLVQLAAEIVARANSLECFATEKILQEMDKDTLAYLLLRPSMNAKEVELFKIALEWGKIQVNHGAAFTVNRALADILPLIRFPTMTLNEFAAVVAPTDLLPQSTLVEIFTYFGSDESAKKDLAKTLKFSTVPREAPIAGTLVSIYEGPIIGREEVWMGTGQDLDDYIRFRVSMPIGCEQGYNDRYNSHGLTKRLAITGITFRFPLREERSGKPSQDSSIADPGDFFKVEISSSPMAMDYGNSHLSEEFESSTATISYSPVKYDWGSDMEAELDPHLVIDAGDDCLIKIRQLDYPPTMYRYRYKSFGTVVKAEDLYVGCDGLRLTDVKTPSRGVRIIHKIRFMEL